MPHGRADLQTDRHPSPQVRPPGESQGRVHSQETLHLFRKEPPSPPPLSTSHPLALGETEGDNRRPYLPTLRGQKNLTWP